MRLNSFREDFWLCVVGVHEKDTVKLAQKLQQGDTLSCHEADEAGMNTHYAAQ